MDEPINRPVGPLIRAIIPLWPHGQPYPYSLTICNHILTNTYVLPSLPRGPVCTLGVS